jgi:hypothetical protein
MAPTTSGFGKGKGKLSQTTQEGSFRSEIGKSISSSRESRKLVQITAPWSTTRNETLAHGIPLHYTREGSYLKKESVEIV